MSTIGPQQIAEAKQLLQRAAKEEIDRRMLAAFLPFLSNPLCTKRLCFADVIDRSIRMLDVAPISAKCGIEERVLEGWAKGTYMPSRSTREVTIANIRSLVESLLSE